MSLTRKIIACIRHAKFAGHACPEWRKDLAMMNFLETDLEEAERQGKAPKGTTQYASEMLTINIKGINFAKTRYQWAEWRGEDPLQYFPYRSYDTDKTKAVLIHAALLDLVAFNKSNPELSLDQLYELIQRKYWR
jgi:hypothetical protein